jgi:hypothetical protein
MNSIEQKIRSITEDRRADYLFDTKIAAEATGMVPNKFGTWWRRNRDKLIDLYQAQPAQVAAEFLAIIAQGEQRKGEQLKQQNKP